MNIEELYKNYLIHNKSINKISKDDFILAHREEKKYPISSQLASKKCDLYYSIHNHLQYFDKEKKTKCQICNPKVKKARKRKRK